MAAKGKWAEGIVPRNFCWILKDRLAVCERPGGYGANHRRVRRKEEILWLKANGFTKVISLIPSTHNLHNYDEHDVAWLHRPFGKEADPVEVVPDLYPELHDLLGRGEKLLVHGEELGDRISGLMAGYLVWAGLLPTGPQAISIVERMVDRQMGPTGRGMVTLGLGLRETAPPAPPARARPSRRGMSDVIELRGLRALGICGALAEEQSRPQPLEVDLDLHVDLGPAGASDALDDTVDYGAAGETVERIITEERFTLLERLAERLAEMLLLDDRVERVTVAVRKVRPPVAQHLDSSGVRITRSRD